MNTATATTESRVEIVRRKTSAMRFGSIQITVHEGKVTQIESTEKTRLQNNARSEYKEN